MLTLFEKFEKSGKISEALIVGQNAFNKYPGNSEVFNAYFSYLCTLAETLPSLSERQQFAEQAGLSLAFYKENVDLSEEIVLNIFEYQNQLDTICRKIVVAQRSKYEAAQEEINAKNSDCLMQLFALKDKLTSASSREKFDKTLFKIGEIDIAIDNDALNAEQTSVYNSLTKDLTELISAKMRDMEYKDNVVYNKKAAEAFAKALKMFHTDEGKYKNLTQLFTLASSTLFTFDAARLFNETLIYYNHVYSYIFSKLDDDGKFALTRYSIECERKMK